MRETTRAILRHLRLGKGADGLLRDLPGVTPEDVQAAAGEALALLEAAGTREDRVARVRARHPHAFEPWTPTDDRHLAEEWQLGAPIAALGRAFGRPPGAIRLRLQRLGIDPRRRNHHRPAASPPSPRPRPRDAEADGVRDA